MRLKGPGYGWRKWDRPSKESGTAPKAFGTAPQRNDPDTAYGVEIFSVVTFTVPVNLKWVVTGMKML
jgi:hypothetical protein